MQYYITIDPMKIMNGQIRICEIVGCPRYFPREIFTFKLSVTINYEKKYRIVQNTQLRVVPAAGHSHIPIALESRIWEIVIHPS